MVLVFFEVNCCVEGGGYLNRVIFIGSWRGVINMIGKLVINMIIVGIKK